MQALEASTAVYLYTGIVDMRLGVERLCEKVQRESSRVVIEGGYYVFFSRKRIKVKLLYWDRDGYAMWHKRLEAGAFKVRSHDGYEEISTKDLEELLLGIELCRIKLRKNVEKGLYS
jgi:transposase